jgi:predicted ATP-dependent serine protease
MARQNNNRISRTRELSRYSQEPAPPLTATARIYDGPGVGLAEIQATIDPPESGKGKIRAVGVPRTEIDQVLQSIIKIPSLSGPDYNIACRLIGAEKWHSSFGLAVTAAIISSYLRKPIPSDYVFLGEIDLLKTVRGGSPRLIENLRRSIESSEVSPDISLVLSSSLRADPLAKLGVRLVPCATLIDVIAAVWQVDPQ